MKKALITLISICVVLIAFTGVSFAKDSLEGSKNITAQVSWQNVDVDGDDGDLTTIMLGFGYFFNDNLELKGVYVGTTADQGGDDTTIYQIGGVLNWNFFSAGQTIVPYVGPQVLMVGYDAEGEDDSEVGYGGQGGVKCFVSEDLSVNIEYNFLTFEIDDVDIDISTLYVGFSYYF